MRITGVQLTNFRNYQRLNFSPDDGLCVFTGQNAAGKTNILEAVFLCALGRSHRTVRDQELIREGEEFGSVALSLETQGGSRTISAKLIRGERKKLLIDGHALQRSGELLGCLNTVMFAPEDLSLVKGGPGERRRFMDMGISQLNPGYYYALQQYNLALKQRNILLKEGDLLDTDLLLPWDEQLARLGAAITVERREYVEALAETAAEKHLHLSGAGEILELAYCPDLPEVEDRMLEEVMRDKLSDGLRRDLCRGSTSVGPHRDDIAMLLSGSDVRIYGSQGQQRSVVLSIKLAELEMIRSQRGEYPVLLLDDVFSELDKSRQRMLLEAVQPCQTFLTCTHLEELVEAGAIRMQVYQVDSGSVVEV